MNLPPSVEELLLPFVDHLQCPAHIAPLHAISPDQFRNAIRSDQVDLALPVAKDMYMGRFVIVSKNDDAQAVAG
jgi:hypothetical protein